MSAELGQIESQLRREIENLEKERREGDQLYENKKQAIAEARDRIAAARGDGDKVTLIKDEMRAKIYAAKQEVLAGFKEQNTALLNALEAQLELIKKEIIQVHEDKKGQQQIFLVLREHGIDEFQNYSPGVLSELDDDADAVTLEKAASFSATVGELGNDAPPAEGEDASAVASPQPAVAGDVDDDMYDEPAEVPAAA